MGSPCLCAAPRRTEEEMSAEAQSEPVAVPAPEEAKEESESGNGPKGDAAKENGDAAQQAEEATAAPEPKEMRAIVLNSFGGLKAVKNLKRPEPTVAEGEVLIRVKACGLNFQDLMLRQGVIDSPPKCPFILGCECAGEVELVGEGVEDFAVGDKVVALPEYKAWAELVAVPSKYVFKLPEEMSYLEAVAITMNYAVAYILLFEMASLTKGKSLLVHSAGGGVGQAIIQLARTVPDITIFGVCSKSKHEALNGTIDHLLERGNDYLSEVRKIKPEGVDIVLDCLCGEECNRGYALLKPMGKYILYGSSHVVTGETKSILSAARSWWQVDKISPLKLFDENKTISGFNLRHLMFQHGGTDIVQKTVNEVFRLFKEGKIKPVTDSTWAFEDVTEAMQKLHERKNIGKIVLDPSMEPKPKPATPAKGKEKKKQLSEEKKDEKKEDKKDDVITNGDSAPEVENGEAEEEKKEKKEEEKASS